MKYKDPLSQAFAELKGVDFDQNMFAQIIKSSIIKSAIDQLEEFFSDFIGLILFGESYLFAFEYLVAPQLSSSRDLQYPDTVFRTQTLQRIAEKDLGMVVKKYASSFLPQQPPQITPEKRIMLLADEVVASHVDELFARARKLVNDANVTIPTNPKTTEVETAFRNGVPFDGEATVGDLINAAWRIFKSETNGTYTRQGREVVDYLTDLVLKSVEIHEIKAFTK